MRPKGFKSCKIEKTMKQEQDYKDVEAHQCDIV